MQKYVCTFCGYEYDPEIGDPEKPKMVFFFDEAHMLFDTANKVLLDKIEQVVKLIRSKGVGIYFITQNPKDIPDGVLAQLGNKVQHALRAYTPKVREPQLSLSERIPSSIHTILFRNSEQVKRLYPYSILRVFPLWYRERRSFLRRVCSEHSMR